MCAPAVCMWKLKNNLRLGLPLPACLRPSLVQCYACQPNCVQASNSSGLAPRLPERYTGVPEARATVFYFLSTYVGSEDSNSVVRLVGQTLPTEPSSRLCFATSGGRKSLLTIKSHQVENSQQTFRITTSHNIKYLI